MSVVFGGRWERVGSLGTGGQGEVLEVVDTKSGRRGAVKVLVPHLSEGASYRARFAREISVLRRLRHPNVVEVLDAGVEEPLWLAMEILPGPSLQAWVARRGPVGLDVALPWVEGVGAGLAAAHALGVVHRDVKPSNILLAADGTPKVIDFGCSLDPDDPRLTQTDQLLGTLRYMAPEQRLDAHRVDLRADVYGLAATLRFLVTGTVGRDLFTWPQRPELLAGVPEPLVGVLQRGLTWEPAGRHPDVAAFLSDLRASSSIG